MELYGLKRSTFRSTEFNQVIWNQMELDGVNRFRQSSMDFSRNQWISTEFNGVEWSLIEFCVVEWNSMEFNGDYQISMEFNGVL